MASNKSVTVLAPNGRRQNVKVTPDTTILQILEEVCKKHDFKPEEYDLRHHNHVLDTSAVMRYSGLPNNAQLEMAIATKAREESSITLGLHLESGDRVTGSFMPTSSLWDVIKTLCPDEADPDSNPVIIYMRREVSGVKHLSTTTLRCLGLTGGRALLRYVHSTPEQLHRQANVSTTLQPRPVQEVKQEVRRSDEPMSVPSTSTRLPSTSPLSTSTHTQPSSSTSSYAMEVDEASPDVVSTQDSYIVLDSEDISSRASVATMEQGGQLNGQHALEKLEGEVIVLGERDAIVFNLDMAESVPREDLPEDFYDLTIEDARALYRDIKKARAELEEAPMQTAALRDLETSQRMLSQLSHYRRTVLRVQFPDRSVLQGVFLPLETVSKVEEFVAKYLDDPAMKFYLFMTPPRTVLAPDARLVEVGCVPGAMLYFGQERAGTRFLRPDLLTRLSSPGAAALVANRSRGMMTARPSSAPSTSRGHAEPTTSSRHVEASTSGGNTQASTSRSKTSDYEPLNKVPKWFKPPK